MGLIHLFRYRLATPVGLRQRRQLHITLLLLLLLLLLTLQAARGFGDSGMVCSW